VESKSPTEPDDDQHLLDQFKQHCETQGYKAHTVAHGLSALREFLAYLRRRCIRPEVVTLDVVSAFLKTRLRRFRQRYCCSPKHDDWARRFANPIERLLSLVQGQWPPPREPYFGPERFRMGLIESYGQWLIDVRGLSEASRVKCSRVARMLLEWLGDRANKGTSLADITVADIDGFLNWRVPGLRRATRAGVCLGLRSFLRYLFWAKVVPQDLSFALKSPPVYQHAEIPRAFSESQVKAIVAAAQADRSAKGLRDHAILLLLATYGLRSGEVMGLRLTDIDWRAETLQIRQSKTGVESRLPLVAPVAQALLKYLRHGRLKVSIPHVFLRSRAPIQPLSHVSALNGIIDRRINEAGLTVVGRHGAHAFRFARALSLLQAAVPMKAIGDVLGHRTVASAEIYLRLDTADLRSISLNLPGKDHHASVAKES